MADESTNVSRALHDHDRRLSAIDRELASLTTSVRELAEVSKAQSESSGKIERQLTDLAATIRTTPKTDMGRLISLAASAGAVVAMLVAGITYIVTGSQQPLIGRIQADQQLLTYRLEQVERRLSAPGMSRSYNGI
jgi:anti-sigma-K factor RskA